MFTSLSVEIVIFHHCDIEACISYRLYRGKWLITTEGRSAVIGHMWRDMWQRDTAAAAGPGDAAAAALQTSACSCTPASVTHHCMQIENIVLNSVKMWIFLYLNLSPAVLIAVSPVSPLRLHPAISSHYITPHLSLCHLGSELLCKPEVETSNSNECGANQNMEVKAIFTSVWPKLLWSPLFNF